MRETASELRRTRAEVAVWVDISKDMFESSDCMVSKSFWSLRSYPASSAMERMSAMWAL